MDQAEWGQSLASRSAPPGPPPFFLRPTHIPPSCLQDTLLLRLRRDHQQEAILILHPSQRSESLREMRPEMKYSHLDLFRCRLWDSRVKIWGPMRNRPPPKHSLGGQISIFGLTCHMRLGCISCNSCLPNRSSACHLCQSHGMICVSMASSGWSWIASHITNRSLQTLSSRSCCELALSSRISTFADAFSFETSG